MGLFSNHLLYFCTPSRIIWWLPSVGRALEKRGCCCPVAAPRWAVQAWCALTAANRRGFGNWCWETGSIGLAPTWELTHSSPPYKSCTLHPKCVFFQWKTPLLQTSDNLHLLFKEQFNCSVFFNKIQVFYFHLCPTSLEQKIENTQNNMLPTTSKGGKSHKYWVGLIPADMRLL